jgi:hypothetical protein
LVRGAGLKPQTGRRAVIVRQEILQREFAAHGWGEVSSKLAKKKPWPVG